MRSRRRRNPVRIFGPGSGARSLSRREVLAGIGTGALLALPDLGLGGRPSTHPGVPTGAALRYAFLYGTRDVDPASGGSLVAAMRPASRTASPLTPVPVAIKLAAAPVSSPGHTVTALATVDMVSDGAKITLTLLDATSAAIAQYGSVTVTGVSRDANILVTPVFAPDSAIVSMVLAVTTPVGRRLVSKAHPHTGSRVTQWATVWKSHHVLAYFDQRSGAMTEPFHLSDEPSLALSTAAANSSDLLLWTTRETAARRFSRAPGAGPAVPAERVSAGIREGPVVEAGSGPVARRGTRYNAADRRRSPPGLGVARCRCARPGPQK